MPAAWDAAPHARSKWSRESSSSHRCDDGNSRFLLVYVASPGQALGISEELKQQGYALMCVGFPRSDCVLQTVEEDEVYDLQVRAMWMLWQHIHTSQRTVWAVF